MVELSVIAPCYNEEDNVRELAARTLRVFETKGISGELVLVDDGSRDATWAVIQELEGAHPGRVVGARHPTNRGIEEGWRSGLLASRGACVCLIDADLQNQPEDIFRLYREHRLSNADVVQGTRSHIGRLRDHRFVMSVALNAILNLCFGMRARDNKSGFVLCRREVLAEILRHRHRYRYFQTFITVAAHARGYVVREVETLFESRIHGKSFMSRLPFKVIADCLVDVAKAVYEYRFGGYRDLVMESYVAAQLPKEAPPPVMRGLRRAWFSFYMWLMPLHHWMIRRTAGYYYDILDRTQWLPAGTLRELQEAKLRRLVSHAYAHVAFYREALDGLGLKPGDIQTLEDLRKLPFLSKQDVRERLYFELMSDNHDKSDVYRITTSGSTGQPLTCWVDRHQLEIRWAATLRSQEWTGYRFGDRTVRLWHQTIGMDGSQVVRERLDSILCRRRLVPAFDLAPDRLRAMERVIQRHRPTLIDGYAEAFHYLARSGFAPNRKKLRTRGLISSAQTLDPASRAAIEETFGAKVFDKYGCREFSGIAYECAHGGHHVVGESLVVEILVDGRPARPGELGEVVITDLNNLVMPFLRYRVGDLAYAVDESVPCPCGRGLPRIGAVEGRVQSIVLSQDGFAIPGSFFLHVLKDYGYAFDRFQIEQRAPGHIVFRYVPAARFHARVLDEVFATFRTYLGPESSITPERVTSIALVHTGKHQAIVNKLPLNYQTMERVMDPRTLS